MTAPIEHRGAHRPARSVAGDAHTLAELLRLRCDVSAAAPASYRKVDGAWQASSWQQLYDDAAAVAGGLDALGVAVGERIAILGPTSYDWGRFDLGGHLAGAVTVGVYPLQAPEQVRYLLENSRAAAIFVADETELATVLTAAEGLETLRAIVPWDSALFAARDGTDPRLVDPAAFAGPPLDAAKIAERQAAVDGDDTAILVYTSGTTGPPKGAEISHANILAVLRSQDEIIDYFEDDLLVAFLPMAHVTERVLSFYLRIGGGVAAAYATSVGAVLGELAEIRPTIFGSVPRLFEKAYDKIRGELARKPWLARRLFAWAEGVARARLPYVLEGTPPPAGLERRYRLAHKLVLGRLHRAFGGRVRAFITGAAPIAPEILELFWAVGLPIYEGYGMTEATVITHINRPGAVRLGTVGRAIPPMTAKIAEDGEIMLHGPFVFKGYLGNPEATGETVRDGWLASGDLGTLDEDGFLRITDRKKHLIITAGGKNVAPANIERAIKNRSPLISQVHAHGDRRPYISAIIAPSPLETLEWGAAEGVLDGAEVEALRAELLADPSSRSEELGAAMARVVAHERFRALFVAPVCDGNRDLARVERVRRFVVLERDFSQEAGELTPTMKMKRKAIEQAYGEIFDRIYDDPDFALEAEAPKARGATGS